jgi:hypothetical protein
MAQTCYSIIQTNKIGVEGKSRHAGRHREAGVGETGYGKLAENRS